MNHLLDKFIIECQLRSLALSTTLSLKNAIGNFIKAKVTDEDSLRTMDSSIIHEYIENCSKGKGRDHLKLQVWALKKFFKFLVAQGFLELDPTRKFGHARSSVARNIPAYLKLYDMDKILDAATKCDDEIIFILVTLLFVTGLRVSELVNLQRRAYSPRRGCIRVKVKGRWIREVPLSDGFVFVLDEYLHKRTDAEPTILLNAKGKRCTANWVRGALKGLGAEIEHEKNLTPNCFRHTFGTHGVRKLGTEMTSCLMGHKYTDTTKVYAHLAPEYFQAIVNKLPLSKEDL